VEMRHDSYGLVQRCNGVTKVRWFLHEHGNSFTARKMHASQCGWRLKASHYFLQEF